MKKAASSTFKRRFVACLTIAIALVCGFILIASPDDRRRSSVVFQDVAEKVGLNFRHYTGATGEFFLPEIMGSGVALFDYDGDGDLDVYLLQGAILDPSKSLKDSLFPVPKSHFPGNRLFRNELIPTGKLYFVDVTEKAGVAGNGEYAMGVAVGDYDNDGALDLYVTSFGHNTLYHNNGDRTFTDVTREAGVDDARWSTGAAWVDYDRDGLLDLFVVNYLAFSVAGNKRCLDAVGQRDYCSPSVEEPVPDRLFRNLGNGKFKDVTKQAGISDASGSGLGVTCADFNGDGWIDILVANDGNANQLWMNKGDGTFENIALISGIAYNADGMAQAGMGITAGDFDNDGHEDVFITHLAGETNTLWVNDGKGYFTDETNKFGLGSVSRPYTGFGTEWFDYDHDGYLDLFVANGAVTIVQALRGSPYPFHQRNQLLHNNRGVRFEDISSTAGPALQLSEVSRGAAFGDIDNDGDIDIVVTNNNGPVRLLLNQVRPSAHWLQVRLVGRAKVNRDGIGARVAVLRESQKPLWRRAHGDGSYLSANDVRFHFGLGDIPIVKGVVVQWPDGQSEIWHNIRADRLITLHQGSGQPWMLLKPGADKRSDR